MSSSATLLDVSEPLFAASDAARVEGDSRTGDAGVAGAGVAGGGGSVPVSVGELRDELRRADAAVVAVVARIDASLVSCGDAAVLAREADRIVRRATAVRTELLGRAAEAGALRSDGGRVVSPERWAAGQLGMTASQAAQDIRTAERLRQATDTRNAFREGRISVDHAGRVAEAAELSPGSERSLLEIAEDAPGKVAGRCRDIKTHAAAREGLAERNRRHHRKRRLLRSETGDLAARVELVMPAIEGARFDALCQPFLQHVIDQARAEDRHEPAVAHRLDALMLGLETGNAAYNGQPLPLPTPSPTDGGGSGDRPGSAEGPESAESVEGLKRPDNALFDTSGGTGAEDPGGADSEWLDRTVGPQGGSLGSSGDTAELGFQGTGRGRNGAGSGQAGTRGGGTGSGSRSRSGNGNGQGNGKRRGRRRKGRPPDVEPEATERTARSGRTTRWGGSSAEVIWRIDEAAIARGYPIGDERLDVQVGGGPPIPVTPEQVHDMFDHDDPRITLLLTRGTDIVRATHIGRSPTTLQKAALKAMHDRCADIDCQAFGNLEIDHLTPWAQGGPTTLDNLAPLCGATHDAKTHRGRQLHRIPGSHLVTAHPDQHPHPPPDTSSPPDTS